jgi:hypothetical protein
MSEPIIYNVLETYGKNTRLIEVFFNRPEAEREADRLKSRFKDRTYEILTAEEIDKKLFEEA